MPKYLEGGPTDELATALSTGCRSGSSARCTRAREDGGRAPDRLGLAQPDHELLEAHPTISSAVLPGSATAHHREAEHRRFTAGRSAFPTASPRRSTSIVYCTGYKITFPFFDDFLMHRQPDPALPEGGLARAPGLYFIGLIQPLGAIMPLAEAQSEWVADILEEKVQLPSRAAMRESSRRPRRERKRYVASPRTRSS